MNNAAKLVGLRRFLRICPRVIIILGPTLLVACTTLRTTTEPVGGPSYAQNSRARVGLYYFLPRALITIECTEPKTGIFNIAVTKRMVADRTHRYHLRWTPNSFYDDKVPTPIAVNAEGLLTNVDFSTTDQTPAIVEDVVSSAISVFKILGGGAQAGKIQAKKALEPFKYTFDPLDNDEVREIQTALANFGIVVRIDSDRRASASNYRYQSSKEAASAAISTVDPGQDTPDERGVFFHPPTTVEMRFDLRRAGEELIHRENVAIPDTRRVACFRFGRSPLVRRDTTLALTDGVPTSFKIERPSVIKALTGTVSSVLSTVAGAVPTIVNVRNSKEVSELNAERTVLEERKKLLQERKSLLEAEKALTEAQGGGPNAGRLPKSAPPADLAPASGFTPEDATTLPSSSPTPTPLP